MNNSEQPTYPNTADQAAFLLGGIGTGNVSVGARGELRDWEIFNRPAKGGKLSYSFFSIWMQEKGKPSIAKVLEAKRNPPFAQPLGFTSNEFAGLPRFDRSALHGEYPFVRVDLLDDALPVTVSMEAFTPLIPLNANDSGIPAAVIRYSVTNRAEHAVSVTIAGSLANAAGFEGYDKFSNYLAKGKSSNNYCDESSVRGLKMGTSGLDENDLTFGSMAIITRDTRVTYKREWLKGSWLDGVMDFWDDFRSDGKLEPTSEFDGVAASFETNDKLKVGSLGISVDLQPGEEYLFEFVLAWHFPNRARGWEGTPCKCCASYDQIEKNYYATRFQDAWSAGKYLLINLERLEGTTRAFHHALFSSTLPWYVIDALASNITVIRSNTCFRIEDGTLLAWEGCFDHDGCCEGSCTHVWNYAQTLAFLFPELEQTMRYVEFAVETGEDGNMAFRTWQKLGHQKWQYLPAADGQMGTIVRLYRDWKFSGNDKLLHDLWGSAKRALDFAEHYWDSDRDFVLDSKQHNTYDIEFYGPNSMINSVYFAALKAGSEIEAYLGNDAESARYKAMHEAGSRKMDDMLWNGEYYVQNLEDVNQYRYQYGTGCLSDQVFGQLLAHVSGLGYILPQEHVKAAIESVYRNNFRTDFSDFHNVLRTYVLNDENGLVLCTWPHGGRPRLPFIYSDEVWTGIEYQVAAHLIYEGFVEEGLTIVRAVRERHDGVKRNPWNEVECGHHYARSMASWALLTALSGYRFDMTKGTIDFKPHIHADDFKCFFSTGKAWGTFSQSIDPATGETKKTIDVLYGDASSVRLNNPQ